MATHPLWPQESCDGEVPGGQCGARLGQYHALGCRAEMCSHCGLTLCGHAMRPDLRCDVPLDDRLAFDGYGPGGKVAAENGWWIKLTANGRVSCDADDPDPGVTPDYHRLSLNYRWSREQLAWVKKESASALG